MADSYQKICHTGKMGDTARQASSHDKGEGSSSERNPVIFVVRMALQACSPHMANLLVGNGNLLGNPHFVYGLDLNLTLSGRRFGVDRKNVLQSLLRRSQRALHLIDAGIVKRKAKVNQRASQVLLHGFVNLRQTYVPKASGSSPIRIVQTFSQ